jgi:CubicO group peptidase (beta-lactamase class C family)
MRTRFQVASVSKQFTAAAVLLLAERGVLAVGDPADRWLAAGPPGWDRVTVHHLLTHTSGLPHWRDLPGLDLSAPASAAELLGRLRSAGLLFAPGRRHSYSSPGYVLLANIVEQAAGLPYAQFLAGEIFASLGMTATFAGNPAGQPDLAHGHRDGRPIRSWDLDTANKGTGDVWSTAPDLAAWDQALARGEFLATASRQAMLTAHTPVDEDYGLPIRPYGYGYGWFLGTGPGGRTVIYHPGDNAGFLALNAWFPDHDTRLIMLTNDETTDASAIIRHAVGLAFPDPGTPGDP